MASRNHKILNSFLAVVLSASATAQFTATAQAQGFDAGNLGGAFSFDEAEMRNTPVLFAADSVSLDQRNNFLSARGNVEIDQAGRTVRADELYYDAKNEELLARGNVLVTDSKGNRMTVSEVALNTEFTKGFMRDIQMRLAPQVRVAASYAERRNENELSVHQAVLTPCPACEKRPERAPLWQIKASQVELDGERGNVYYRNARFELFGLPVFFAPFFAHADPRVDRKSGFLTPRLDLSSKRGYGLEGAYFLDLTDSTDVTVKLTPYAGRYWTDINSASNTGGNGLGGAKAEVQFRQAIPRGLLTVDTYGLWETNGSYLDEQNFINDDNDELHGLAVAQFDWGLTDNLRLKTKGHLWSSNEAPLEFGVDSNSVISDTAQLEGFFGRNYIDVYGETNRVARSGLTTSEHEYPLFGKASMDFISEPLLAGGTLRGTVDARQIYRKSGRDYQRGTVEAWWHQPLTIPGGVKVDAQIGGFASFYQIEETDTANPLDPAPLTPDYSGSAVRAQPGASVVVSWPLHKAGENWSQTVTPVLGLSYGGPDSSIGEIPNEDSADVELDEGNLFLPFRTSGYDAVDPGLRVNYGIKYDLLDASDSALSVFIGQSYSFEEDDGLLATQRPEGSGIEDQLSHVIAGIDADFGFIRGTWRTRYDIDDSTFYRNDLSSTLSLGPLSLTGTYGLRQANDQASKAEAVSLSSSLTLFEDFRLSAGYSQDLQTTDIKRFTSGLRYTHPCAILNLGASRSFDSTGEYSDKVNFSISIPFLSASVGQQLEN